MNTGAEYEKQLETAIDRELRGLPELQAPAALQQRVLAAIRLGATAPWYRRSWEYWPVALRWGSLAFLLAFFGAVVFAGWELSRAAGFAAVRSELAGLFSGVSAVWNTVHALLAAVALVAKHLGTPFIVGCGVALAVGYAICVGLGTAFVRLAYARR